MHALRRRSGTSRGKLVEEEGVAGAVTIVISRPLAVVPVQGYTLQMLLAIPDEVDEQGAVNVVGGSA